MKNTLITRVLAGSVGLAALLSATAAMAVPSLQLFIEQADYEDADENTSNPADDDTWAKLGTTSFKLWVFGDIDSGNPHIQNRIRDVTFVASFANTLTPSLAFTPTSTSVALSGFADPSTPGTPTGPVVYANSDDIPGDPITPHSPFGAPNRKAAAWNLGLFDKTDSPLGNTEPAGDSELVEASTNWFPAPLAQKGQINVYDVLVSGLPVGAQVHFDVYGVLQEYVVVSSTEVCTGTYNPANGKCDIPGNGPDDGWVTENTYGWVDVFNGPNLSYVENAYSHDARWEQAGRAVPEPMTLSLLGAGLIGAAWMRRRRA